MTEHPVLEAAERARALLAEKPWNDRTEVLTLLAVQPPEAAPDPQQARLWLIADAGDLRDLDGEWREPLLQIGLRHVFTDSLDLTVVTSAGLAALLDGMSRRSLEVRWEIHHADALLDPRGRCDRLRAAASRLPEGALERLVRPLYLQAQRGLQAAAELPVGGTTSAIGLGEAASALTRLACILEEGGHPTIEWLPAAARATALGRRLAPWLDSLATGTGAAVLDEVVRALRAEFADREWLRDPDGYWRRPPQQRR